MVLLTVGNQYLNNDFCFLFFDSLTTLRVVKEPKGSLFKLFGFRIKNKKPYGFKSRPKRFLKTQILTFIFYLINIVNCFVTRPGLPIFVFCL